ncbi:MAG: hypothetical protein ABSF12_04270 [Bryobacteraceae bacterium]|jgi:hypothetical protein
MPGAQRDSAFLNIPYDRSYEEHFLAYISGLAAFGLDPRATLELTSGERRLDRIFKLIAGCRYSFHDLSLVKLDRKPPATPRFNMPFELGLVVGWQQAAPSGHDWFVFESSRHRLQKSLSDLNGTDPFIYGPTAEGILREIRNALARHDVQPTAEQMLGIFKELKGGAAPWILDQTGAPSVFQARPFAELVVMAREYAEVWVPGLLHL